MTGQTIAHYQITSKLGEGGMGEVYRATDTKLGRDVAIKVLPVSISRDATSLARFEREAKALAALNHPHIAAIHGFDADQGTHFLVLELVEGATLAERLRRGALPVDESLRVARQIAEAVEAAHAKGIIHRDLKPGNIKLTPEGRVKVLDFGLAKMEESVRGRATPASDPDAPTLPAETTQPGAVMGTPAYMSPEQARGQEVDKRTDVWAFGCCLFECLAGSKPFRGVTVTDLMAEVLKSEPDWSALPAEVPREVATLLRRCLEKDPRRRLSSLGDIAILLEDSTPTRQTPSVPSPPVEAKHRARVGARTLGPRLGLALGVAGVTIGLSIAGIGMWRQPKSASRASQIRSLAVLPFDVNAPDPKLAGMDKWIPVEIVSKLGQVTNLQVVNLPAKIEQLVAQKKSEDEIARELKVDGLVRGQLHGQGEAMTVYVSVVDGATGHPVGETRKLATSNSRISEIPNQVAVAVVEELKLQINATQRSGLQESETKNSEAFLAYQRGRDLLSSRKFTEAAVELRRAYQLDPNYTRAWTDLAGAEWIPLIYGGSTNELQSTFKRLSREAERFRAQRPDDQAVASLRMWIALIYERDWNKVRAIYWESLRIRGPDADQARVWMYFNTYIDGHPELAAMARNCSPSRDTVVGFGRWPFRRTASGLSRAVGITRPRSGIRPAVRNCSPSGDTAARFCPWPFRRTASGLSRAVRIRRPRSGIRPAQTRWPPGRQKNRRPSNAWRNGARRPRPVRNRRANSHEPITRRSAVSIGAGQTSREASRLSGCHL
jgi:serine/threonine protein kinase